MRLENVEVAKIFLKDVLGVVTLEQLNGHHLIAVDDTETIFSGNEKSYFDYANHEFEMCFKLIEQVDEPKKLYFYYNLVQFCNQFKIDMSLNKNELPQIVKDILESWCDDKLSYLKELEEKDLTENSEHYGMNDLNEVEKFLGLEPTTIKEVFE